MSHASPHLFFDYVDPLCYLLELELAEVTGEPNTPAVTRIPAEVRPPPTPLIDPDDPWWVTRWEAADVLAGGLGRTLVQPLILPWTRKAHELVRHAREHDLGDQAHLAVFDALFGRGRDIGRVDVLVELALGVGLDPNEAKAVLDVDRYTGEVAGLAARAREAGVDEIPTLLRGSEKLQGFHNRDTLRTFLLR